MIDRAQIHHKVLYFSTLLLVVTVPPYANLMNVAMIVIILNWVLEGNFSGKYHSLKDKRLFILFSVFYLLHVLSLIYTENLSEGLNNLGQKIMLLAFPLIWGTSSVQLTKNEFNNILKTFVGSTLVVSLVCLGYGFFKFLNENTTAYLLHDGLISLVGAGAMQPVYFALYVCFSTSVLIYFLLRYPYSRKAQVGLILLVVYFFGFTILTGARTATLALMVILFGGGYYYSRKIKQRFAFLVFIILLTTMGAGVSMRIPALRERIMAIAESKLYFDPKENNANGLTLRLVKWQCSLESIRSNPLFGVGIGDAQDHLQECYEQKNFWGRLYRFNSHNEYLQSALGLGLAGLLLLLCCLACPLAKAFKTGNYLYVMFLVLISLAFLTESMLERKQGIIFYSFINSFLALQLYENKQERPGGQRH
jgi:O-antigen ligase